MLSYATRITRRLGTDRWIRRVVTWVPLALLAVLVTEVGLAVLQSPAPDPAQLLQDSLTAAGARDSFHYSDVWRSGDVSQTIVGDARTSSGTETVSAGSDEYTVVFTGRVAYVEGDAAAMHDELGLAPAIATEYAGKWVSIQPTDAPYSLIENGLTTSAGLAQILISPSSASPTSRVHGVPIARITGRVPHGRSQTGSAQLDLLSLSKLPASYSAHGTEGGQTWSNAIVFSRWDEKGPIVAPPDALPFSSL